MKRLQQKDVSEKTGIGQTSISNYETGDVTPTLENLIILADFYNTSLDFLCSRDTETAIVTKDLTPSQVEMMQRLADEFRIANKNGEDK